MISKFPKVAIIVPIYNVENYLERCLQSLQKQTHQNLLIVLINDGSTDQSKEIAQRYVQTDSRFMLIDQQNGGLSHARNKGLSFLEGKLSSSYPPPPIEIDFLSFVDSDDYLECDCIEKSLLELQRHQAQIVCFGINRCEENGAKIRSDFGIFEQVSKNQVLDGAEVLKQTRKNYFHSVWGSIIDYHFFQSLKLKFIEGIIYEDHCFGTFLFLRSQRIVILDQYLYSQVNSTNSITRPKHITQERKILNLKSWIKTIEELEKFPLHTKLLQKQIRKFYLPMAYHCLFELDEQNHFRKDLKRFKYWSLKIILIRFAPKTFQKLKKMKTIILKSC